VAATPEDSVRRSREYADLPKAAAKLLLSRRDPPTPQEQNHDTHRFRSTLSDPFVLNSIRAGAFGGAKIARTNQVEHECPPGLIRGQYSRGPFLGTRLDHLRETHPCSHRFLVGSS
jgi:hypothetical protein